MTTLAASAQAGVLRRVQERRGIADDESFSRDLNGSSHRSCMPPSAATRNTNFVPIGEEEAERIVARIRGLAASEE